VSLLASWACCWQLPDSAAPHIVEYKWIFIALVLGTIIGVPLGKVAMTAVPQRTALSHAFGALCVALVGTAEFLPAHARCAALPDGVLSVK